MIHSIIARTIFFNLLLLYSYTHTSAAATNEIPAPSKLHKLRRSYGLTSIADIARAYNATQYGSARQSLPKTYQSLRIDIATTQKDIKEQKEQTHTDQKTAKIHAPRPIKPIRPELLAIINRPPKSPYSV